MRRHGQALTGDDPLGIASEMELECPLRVAIVGSRRRDCKAEVERLVNDLPKNTVVISGGCRGVDSWAEAAARARGLKVVVHRPRMRGAQTYYEVVKRYYERNARIAKDCDVMYAFVHRSRTGGTENAVKAAERFGKGVVIL